MYQVPHLEYYKLYNASVDEFIDYFYSKEELVRFISKWYVDYDNPKGTKELYNKFIKQCVCNKNDLFKRDYYYGYTKIYILYDNYDRIINVKDFEQDALIYYFNKKNQPSTIWQWWWRHEFFKKGRQRRRFNHNYEYRKDPVPYIHKWRGGSMWSPPHTFQIVKMYANPEYKGFNRGTKKEVPLCWDDRSRKVQKSWKEQSKARHQWQRKQKT